MSASTYSLGSTPLALRVQLSGMMFIQYFMQGCYLPVASLYLKASLGWEEQLVGNFFAALSIGPLLAPFLVGQLVDRHFATQRVLAVCHLLAGLLMLAVYTQRDFWPVAALGTAYSVLWVPTMMLTNALALHHLVQRDREFPRVRLWGTIGFILPAWLIEGVFLRGLEGDALNAARGVTFALSGAAGLVMSVYAWLLPNTPPSSTERKTFAPGQALGLVFRRRDFAVLVLIGFGIALVHQFYFVWNSPFLSYVLKSGGIAGAYEQRISSLGQVSEVVVLALVGGAIARWGFKPVLFTGAMAYALRCLLFTAAALPEIPFTLSIGLTALGNAMHGLCFGAFLAVAYMYVDRVAPPDVRGSMQTIFGTFILGSGFFLGGVAAGLAGKMFNVEIDGRMVINWVGLWGTCATFALVCALLLAVLFPRSESKASP